MIITQSRLDSEVPAARAEMTSLTDQLELPEKPDLLSEQSSTSHAGQ